MSRHEVVLIPQKGSKQSAVEMPKEPSATEPTEEQKSLDGRTAMLGALAYSTGKKIVVGAATRVGSTTGDYIRANNIRNVQTIAGYGLALAINPIAGALYIATDIGFKAYDYNLKMDKANKETALYRASVGISTSQGSRRGGRK